MLWMPNPNRKCFDVIISPILAPCIKSAAYDSTAIVIFSYLETLYLSDFKTSGKSKWTDSGIFLSDVENCSVFGVHGGFVCSLQYCNAKFLLYSLQSI